MGGEEASGQAEGRSGQFQTADAYWDDICGNPDYDYGSGIYKYVRKQRRMRL